MLIFNKILPLFLLPIGLVCLLLLAAWWRRQRWLIGLALVILYVSSLPLVGNRLLGWLETRYPAVPLAAVEKADAVVVLGGIMGPRVAAGYLPNVSEAGERIEAAVVMLQQGKVPQAVFMGGRIPWAEADRTEGEDVRDYAIAHGVPSEKIIVSPEVGNTADEARVIAALMRERGWQKIVLVTTGWHMPRAAYLFERAGVNAQWFPVDFRCGPSGGIGLLDFLPSTDGLGRTELILRELYGNLFYRLKP